jgi:hypothetical protein
MPRTQLTTIGTFHMAKNCFSEAANECDNLGTANIAAGLMYLSTALLAELTQMSQDIAVLKAEVAALKPKPTGLQYGSHAFLKK